MEGTMPRSPRNFFIQAASYATSAAVTPPNQTAETSEGYCDSIEYHHNDYTWIITSFITMHWNITTDIVYIQYIVLNITFPKHKPFDTNLNKTPWHHWIHILQFTCYLRIQVFWKNVNIWNVGEFISHVWKIMIFV